MMKREISTAEDALCRIQFEAESLPVIGWMLRSTTDAGLPEPAEDIGLLEAIRISMEMMERKAANIADLAREAKRLLKNHREKAA